MASMDDLIATINGGMHVGQQANDLKDLHVRLVFEHADHQAKLAQTLNPSLPVYRPIPPQTSSNNGPVPPPAPVSSWNSPPPSNAIYNSPNWSSMGVGQSPRQGGYANLNGINSTNGLGAGQRETGFSIPSPKQPQYQYQNQQMPNHKDVLPVSRATPEETNGFENDAFRPLRVEQEKKGEWSGFKR